MDKKDELEIDSLVNFIDFVTKLPNAQRFLYRGENKDYGTSALTAGGYRINEKNNFIYKNLRDLRKKYFKEIAYSLNKVEKENFMAYSQHHGLPTELLDVTTNPLVALWFSCEDISDLDGVVYLIEESGGNIERYEDTDKNLEKIDIFEQYWNLTEETLNFEVSRHTIIIPRKIRYDNIIQLSSRLLYETSEDVFSTVVYSLCDYILKNYNLEMLENNTQSVFKLERINDLILKYKEEYKKEETKQAKLIRELINEGNKMIASEFLVKLDKELVRQFYVELIDFF